MKKDGENRLQMCYSRYIHIKVLSDRKRNENDVGEDDLMI